MILETIKGAIAKEERRALRLSTSALALHWSTILEDTFEIYLMAKTMGAGICLGHSFFIPRRS